MLKIITDRLVVIPLNQEMLEETNSDFTFVEESLGLNNSEIKISES